MLLMSGCMLATQKDMMQLDDNLTQMRLKEMVDDDEYLREKTRLKNGLTKLRLKMNDIEQRADDWLKLTEQTFEFACYAHKAFLFGDAQMKREILATVSHLNPTLKDHLLNIHGVEWLVPIKEQYPALKAKYDAFEPALMQTEQGRNEVFTALRPNLRGRPDLNR